MSAVTDTVRNGVDTEKMFATLDLIKAPELARFQFRATNRWIEAHNRSMIKGFYAAGGEDTTRSDEFHADAGSRRSCSAPTRGRTRPSTSCTPSPPA